MSEAYQAAQAALRAGLSTIPPKMNGSKAPLSAWKQYQGSTPTENDLAGWYSNGQTGVGLVCGAVSGGLECLDFDTKDAWDSFYDAANDVGLGPVLAKVIKGYGESSPNGYHLLYKCSEIEGNTKLAGMPDNSVPNGTKTLIETRGEGGFIIVAPSSGNVNPAGDYVLDTGGFDSIATIFPAEREQLHRLARTFDKTPTKAPLKAPASNDGNRPGDAFNQRATWAEVLIGWKSVFERDGVTHWRRPGKSKGESATTNHEGSDLLYVFTTNTVFESKQSYSKFGAYALLNHNGDFKAAARALGGTRPSKTIESSEVDVIQAIPAELTEDSLALAFAEQHKNNLRYCHTRGSWFAWDGSRWKQEKTLLAFHYARELCREYNRNLDKNAAQNVAKVRTAAAVEKFAIADRSLAATEELWNVNPWLLATPDGTIDLKTGQLLRANPDNHITLCTSVTPGSGKPELWLKFLDEATNGDKELQSFLQQVAGYCLTGITREHALFFLYGSGGNGKGIFVNAIADVMGEYATSAPMDSFTASKHDRHPTDIASLAGSRMVTASETEKGRAWAESRIKQITGGDPIKARFMRQDFFEYMPEFKLVFLGNHKPVLENVDDAAKRRFNIIPFTHKPATPDLMLSEKLKSEYGGILQWMIDGCLDWQANGLIRPPVVKNATAEYFDEQDLFGQWLDEATEKRSDRVGERSGKLYASWKAFAKSAGDEAGTLTMFRDTMRQNGFAYSGHLPGDNNGTGFVGISIKIHEDKYKAYAE